MKNTSSTYVAWDDPMILADQDAGKIVCATSLIISISTKRVVLVLNDKMGKINPPGGKLEGIYDNLQIAAKREIEEEVGIGEELLQEYDFVEKDNGDILVKKSSGKQAFLRNDGGEGIVDYLGVFMTETELSLQFLNEIKGGEWAGLDDEFLHKMAKKYFPEKSFEDCFFVENLEVFRRLKI